MFAAVDQPPIPPHEQARRLPVWVAMSELWLDNELSPTDHRRLADALCASGYTVAELTAICRHEVAPVVGGNLRQVAGAWSGFDPAVLKQAILHHLARPTWRHRLQRWLNWPDPLRPVARDWQQMIGIVMERRGPSH